MKRPHPLPPLQGLERGEGVRLKRNTARVWLDFPYYAGTRSSRWWKLRFKYSKVSGSRGWW